MEHKDLTDPYLHEPKGASTAEAGQVYVANGEGAGSFQKLPLTYVAFETDVVNTSTLLPYPPVYTIKGNTLLETLDGNVRDIVTDSVTPLETLKTLNKNTKELWTSLETVKENVLVLETFTKNINDTLNTLITTLKTAGVIK